MLVNTSVNHYALLANPTISLNSYLSKYCIDLKNQDQLIVFKQLRIDISSSICARCEFPFDSKRIPVKIGLVDEEECVYLIFCDHCDNYIRNADKLPEVGFYSD